MAQAGVETGIARDDPGGIPSAWGQAFPRAVTLAPDGPLVPAGTLRVLLKPGRTLPLQYVGFALAPWIDHGATVPVEGAAMPRAGDVALCDMGGWGDLLRVLAVDPSGDCLLALDAAPAGRARVAPRQVLGVVRGTHGAGGRLGRLLARLFPVWSRAAGIGYWYRKVREAPDGVTGAVTSVGRKYAGQVDSYQGILDVPLGAWTLDLVREHVPAGARLLVPGSGVGREALHLARAGYVVTGLDIVPGMVEASNQNARSAGLNAEFLEADMAELDLRDRAFEGAYITPLVYSFVPGRERRIECLRGIGRHLAPGGAVIFSAHLIHRASQALRLVAVTVRRRLHHQRDAEFGDWFTWFLTPEGRIEKSFSHRFVRRQVQAEARAAGFGSCEFVGQEHFVARGYRA